MSLHSRFSRHFYWPLVQKIKGESAAEVLQQLCRSQWKSSDEINRLQWQLVKRVVNKAANEAFRVRTPGEKPGLIQPRLMIFGASMMPAPSKEFRLTILSTSVLL